MSSPGIKNISLNNSGNQNYNFRHPGPPEGRFAIVTMRWAGMRWTPLFQSRASVQDDGTKAYGEVVWSWRRDVGAKFLRRKLHRSQDRKNSHLTLSRQRNL